MKEKEETPKSKVRYANMELLRILSMYMIIMYHIVRHCVSVQLTNPGSLGRSVVDCFNHPVFYKKLLILNSMMTFGNIGNAVFILISGYFMANRKPQDIKMGAISQKLLLQSGFAVVFLMCGAALLHLVNPALSITMPDISIFNTAAWFVGYYFMVVLCGALFLNKFLAKWNVSHYAAFLLTLFAFVQFGYSGALAEGLANGLRTVLTGIFLYALGGFIKKFNPFQNVRLIVLFLVMAGSYVLIWISGYNVTETSIEAYIRSGKAEPFTQTVPIFENYGIIIIIISVCLFEIFCRIRLPESKVISFIGKSTFMVYLIHNRTLFYELWNLRDWVTTLAESPLCFAWNILKWSTYTFAVGIAAYILFAGIEWLWKKKNRENRRLPIA